MAGYAYSLTFHSFRGAHSGANYALKFPINTTSTTQRFSARFWL